MTKANVARYSLSKNLVGAGGLSEEEKRAVEERIKVLAEILTRPPQARYKLEVLFSKSRSLLNPFPGVITFWDNGNKMHGGGDSKLSMCPGKHVGKNDCEAFISDTASGNGFMVCMKCNSLWKSEQVIGEVIYKLPIQHWATVMTKWFIRMDMDADIRIKYARDDIRHAARLEQERQRGGDLLRQVRDEGRRTTAIYPVGNLVKDLNAGADVEARILAFLRA